ncbi:MAG: hypothetical protein SEPTF4163_005687 [Sporothrix epigloea]
MFASLNLVKALPFALMLSTALANPVPETNSTAKAEKRIVGNEATYLFCVSPDHNCGFFATYTNGETRQTVSWTTGKYATDDECLLAKYQKHTNDAGFWLNINFHWNNPRYYIGYNPTSKIIYLGDATWTLSDQDYLNGRCQNEFGDEFSTADLDSGSKELYWGDLGQPLY